MHQWTGSVLVKIMAWRLFGAKPLSKPMLGYCQLNGLLGTNFSEIWIGILSFSLKKMHLKLLPSKLAAILSRSWLLSELGHWRPSTQYCLQHQGKNLSHPDPGVASKTHIDGLIQERCDSNALAMDLRLSCTNPSIWDLKTKSSSLFNHVLKPYLSIYGLYILCVISKVLIEILQKYHSHRLKSMYSIRN